MTPRATYRLQFGPRLTFADAERLVPYLAELGISHIYASPYLKARAGSTHGYDITDYNALNPEIGDEAALAGLAKALRRQGMGQVLDFVPNHMGIGKADNAWWLDVLEWGPGSPYSDYFDIDWVPAKTNLHGKILLPVLGDHYGNVLERGELVLGFEDGRFVLRYHEHLCPIRPATYRFILGPLLSRLRAAPGTAPETIAWVENLIARSTEFRVAWVPLHKRPALRERALQFRAEIAETVAARPELRTLLEDVAKEMNGMPGNARSFLGLHKLLERQFYRLAYWRVASAEINYRRFFDVNELAGVRMERSALFEVAHRLVWRLISDFAVDGLRIDHIDGMLDPAGYCRRLAAQAATVYRPQNGEDSPFYIVVEKILAAHEPLRESWPIAGSSGYEALNLLHGLFVRPDAEKPLGRIYRRFTGDPQDFATVLYACKKLVLRQLLASELEVLVNELDRMSERHWNSRDFTRAGLRAALEEIVACFPVYRTYVDERDVTPEDRRDIDWAVSVARRRAEDSEDTLFDFIHGLLTTDLVRRRRSGYNRRAVIQFAMKFQQFTGPVTAKAMEDTSFYRYFPLLSLNEVGGDPRRMGVSIGAFHHQMQERASRWPAAMTATGTHDTKRGEDARVRIDVLSELPDEWAARSARWATLNRAAKIELDGVAAPDRADEFFLYQVLVGSWPVALLDPERLDEALLDAFRERLEGCMIKSLREGKRRSSWARPDAAYEEAMLGFVRRLLDPRRSSHFLADFVGFERRVAWFGMLNGLSQTLLKLAMPGVPDFYQGAELWDYRMVDPDNRRPVDFERRIAYLQDMKRSCGGDGVAPVERLRGWLENWSDGRIKLYLIWRMLTLRKRMDMLFRKGSYVPVRTEGRFADHICAFARAYGDELVVAAAPRLLVGVTGGDTAIPTGDSWQDTIVFFPPELVGRELRNVLTGEAIDLAVGEDGAPNATVADLLRTLPVGAWTAA